MGVARSNTHAESCKLEKLQNQGASMKNSTELLAAWNIYRETDIFFFWAAIHAAQNFKCKPTENRYHLLCMIVFVFFCRLLLRKFSCPSIQNLKAVVRANHIRSLILLCTLNNRYILVIGFELANWLQLSPEFRWFIRQRIIVPIDKSEAALSTASVCCKFLLRAGTFVAWA